MKTPSLSPTLSHPAAILLAQKIQSIVHRYQANFADLFVQQKPNGSYVTSLDYALQLLITHWARPSSLIAEEDISLLLKPDHAAFKSAVHYLIQLSGTRHSLDELIQAQCNLPKVPQGHYWVLDPVDGTKGLLNQEEFSTAIASLTDTRSQSAIIGSFGYPDPGMTMFISTQDHPEISIITPLSNTPETLDLPPDGPMVICLSRGRFQSKIAPYLQSKRPDIQFLCLHSQCKYVALLLNHACAYIRCPNPDGRREYIWDHLPGIILAQKAGFIVSDFKGHAIETQGDTLLHNRGILVCRPYHHPLLLSLLSSF